MTFRIAIAGYRIESSMFSKLRAGDDAFVWTRGQELLESYALDRVLGARAAEIEWLPLLRAAAGAGGPVETDTFERIAGEIVAGLRDAGPLDGIYLDLHGASHVLGVPRAEEELLRRIREVVGAAPLISVSMDPHGNFSRELAELVDLATSHRHSPHIDNELTRERAITTLVAALEHGGRPHKAWVRVPVLLPGEQTSTAVEPGATVFGAAQRALDTYDVLDTGIWIGFAWADEDRNAAAVLVTGWDRDAAVACARELAAGYWDAREDFVLVADHTGSWDEALAFAASRPALPLWISDSGDNVTAGASGDITYALRRTLDDTAFTAAGLRTIFTGLVDRDAVAAAAAVGEGGTIDRAIGAGIDARYGAAVEGPWRVHRLIPEVSGEGFAAAILDNGTVHVGVHVIGVKFVPLTDATVIPRPGYAWYELDGYDVVVVKNGYLFPSQASRAATWFMALTPGGTDLDFDRLEYTQVWRPLFPFDRDFEPELEPVVLSED